MMHTYIYKGGITVRQSSSKVKVYYHCTGVSWNITMSYKFCNIIRLYSNIMPPFNPIIINLIKIKQTEKNNVDIHRSTLDKVIAFLCLSRSQLHSTINKSTTHIQTSHNRAIYSKICDFTWIPNNTPYVHFN